MCRIRTVVAATDLHGDLGWAGAATEEEFSVSPGMYNFNTLHGLLNSHGWVADAATDLHENLLNGVFSLHAFGGHGGAASVLGDTGSAAFPCTDSLIHDSFANSSFHPIHACAHSCFDGRRAGFGVCGGGCALAPVSFLSDVADVPDDEDDACVDGVTSVIQGFGSHATACSSLDTLHNSRWARGHCLRGGTKCTSTGSRDQVWLSDESKEYFSQQESESLHVEAWADAKSPQKGFQVQGVMARCASVSLPFGFSDLTSVLPGPGSEIRKLLGWTQLEKTGRSGVWFFRGAYQGEDLFSSLAVSGDWVKKGSYHTAWSVPGDSLCSCSYAYGHGPAIGSHTGKQKWELLSWLWRTIAPLMKPWCAEGEVPTAANLNLCRGGNSRVNWHSDNEPLFGGSGVHKLIVSVSFGAPVLFKWRGKSCLDSGERSCWLGHGDLLVMDGQCQDEFLHCTSPGLEHERINVTYRWIRQHTHFCPLFKAGVVCWLPTCAKGSSVQVTGNSGYSCFWAFWFLLCVLCMLEVLGLVFYLPVCTKLGSCWCAFFGVTPLGR